MKRLLLIFICAVLLCCLVIPAISVENTTTAAHRTLTIVAPDNWSDLHIYARESQYLGPWPGTPLQKSGDVYTITLKSSMRKNLVIHGVKRDGSYVGTTEFTLADNGRNVIIYAGENANIDVKYAAPAIPKLARAFYDLGRSSNYRVVCSDNQLAANNLGSDPDQLREMEPGIFRRTFTNVTPGEYQLKIVNEAETEDAYGNALGEYYSFVVPSEGTVSVELNVLKGIIEICGQNFSCTTLTAAPLSGQAVAQMHPVFMLMFSIPAICTYLLFLLRQSGRSLRFLTHGGPVSQHPRYTRKAVAQAVKDSTLTPSADLDRSILDAIKQVKPPPPAS